MNATIFIVPPHLGHLSGSTLLSANLHTQAIVICTGQYAPKSLIMLADIVSTSNQSNTVTKKVLKRKKGLNCKDFFLTHIDLPLNSEFCNDIFTITQIYNIFCSALTVFAENTTDSKHQLIPCKCHLPITGYRFKRGIFKKHSSGRSMHRACRRELVVKFWTV